MTNALMPSGYPGGYAAYYQQVIKPVEDAIPTSVREANAASHYIIAVEDGLVCYRCDIKAHNVWKAGCVA